MKMNLAEFNSRYVYQTDKEQFGIDEVWEVMEPNVHGLYTGDCESYCLTLIDRVDGFQEMELWYATFGNYKYGHCVGKLGDKWIDCNTKKLVDFFNYGNDFRIHNRYNPIRIWINKFITKIKLWRRGR